MDDYPLILWGPYFWANGEIPNDTILGYEQSLGALSYNCWHWCTNGGHPSTDADACSQISGRKLISERMFNFFKNDTVATDWFRARPARKHTVPSNATIDRLQDFGAPTNPPTEVGTTAVTFEFDQQVREAGSSDSHCEGNTDCFVITTTCTSTSEPGCDVIPSVSSVIRADATNYPNRYTVNLTHQVVPGQWTTIRANVELAAAPNAGIRLDPLDRVDLAFLPGDCVPDGTVNTADYDALEEYLGNLPQNPDLTLYDINRDGFVTSADLTRLQQLLQGTNTTRAWNNYTLPSQP